ncbi:DNA recombination protein RmuC [Moheibacter sediminis]|uniref:DNA recombination protein RmuC n=1 Tax=Moheibacter sediminis TaxID=1434700 RepID=A0A1W2CFD1_9FLAO|nr:DNA recombination protein RmuC [Moheibacter sediminis]SMC83871.1 DNA recombination protein RmuC [Moheibacter sediminis]
METLYWALFLLALSAGFFFLGNYISSLKSKAALNSVLEREKSSQNSLVELKSESEKTLEKLEFKLNSVEVEKEKYVVELAQQKTENASLIYRLDEHKAEIEQLNQKFQKEFENLAQKILEEKSEKFTQQNKLNLEIVLNPLKEKIKDFETKVEASHKDSLEKNASLKQQIEDLSKLNERINQEAHNLTRALKGDQKMQGNWGEVILERILERSGLERDREYFIQKSYSTEDKRRIQPDVVVNLPENKSIIIDSKVSLVAFERYFNEEDETQKPRHLKEHINSVRAHIKSLSDKQYQNIYDIKTLDFVLLFIPIESAFSATTQSDSEIFNDAFERNIVIVSPSTLLATLRTISSIWKFEHQNRNALEIARKSGDLYDQFVNLTDDLIKLGNQIKTVNNSYDSSMKKLTGKGNLIKKVEDLKKMGAKTSKSLSERLIERADENLD